MATFADSVGINTEPVANLDLNGSFITRKIALSNIATTGGSIGLATATVDIASFISIFQTTSGISVSIPTPTNSTSGRRITIGNIGNVSLVVSGFIIYPLEHRDFTWDSTASAWLTDKTTTQQYGNTFTKEFNSSISTTNSSVTFDLTSAGFTNIVSVQAIAGLGGTTALTAASAISVTAISNTSVTLLILESNTSGILIGGTTEGLTTHTTSKTVWITVKGT